ncbi:hypothetical protein F4778DRAFT_716175 [Xylariomycetidae sp. FL2044]|nr:hypothetical protein F4778DRAFT_716175 [Xylariomycetidae sp. FL2044]
MQFSPSPRGHHVLAYNSSRIYILDVREPSLAVKRELKILRRPASACILDDGSLLAVLSSDMQIDIYDLDKSPPRRKQSLILDNTPRAIALSPCGSVLAAAYEGGIEVSSINPGASPTERRAVKCDGVDSLAFSLDGTQLLGTTTASHIPNTVILTAPYYDPGAQMSDDSISALWTTSILFPNTSRDCSHAVLLQESSSVEATWTFTYDRSFETFRAVRIDDLRNGTTYFTGPVPTASSPGPLLPCTLPSASYQGELVSAGFEGKDIWIYGVPEDLEAVPEGPNGTSDSSITPALHRRNSGLSVRSPSRLHEANGARVPQWQILCDKFRNTFVSGRKITELCGVSNVKWVGGFGSTLQERLIIAARGVLPPKSRLITEEEGIEFVDGGRITILDFDYGPDDGEEEDITIEVGTREPEVLEEEHRDIDAEVAIVRRRTVAQRRGNRTSVMRAATTAARQTDVSVRPQTAREPDPEDPLVPRPMATARQSDRAPGSDEVEDVSLEEAAEALDAPYAHASPRSGTTLRRAATAAAVNRQRNPQPATAGPVEYRRADGRREHPHESDADNWVPPPPPYAKEDPGDMPAFLRHAHTPISSGVVVPNPSQSVPPVPRVPYIPPVPPIPQALSAAASNRPELPRIRTSPTSNTSARTPGSRGIPHQLPHQRITSDSASTSRHVVTSDGGVRRPLSSPPAWQARPVPQVEEDIYDVSPIGSPSQTIRPRLPNSSEVTSTSPDKSSPNQPSAGTASSAAEYTPASASTSSYHTPAGSSSTSGGLPRIDTDVYRPATSAWKDEPGGPSPIVGQLPNPQTWPRVAPGSNSASAAALTGYPRSAPAVNVNNAEMIAASLPPAPAPDQVARLHSRQNSSGAPRPASGSFQFPRVPVGSRSGTVRGSRRYSGIPEIRPPPPEEQPLIISTPTGVAGAYDLPSNSQTSGDGPSGGLVLHAPVPRHPRPISTSHLLRPTVERLETISSIGGDAGVSNNNNQLIVPIPPPSQLTTSSLRHHNSIARRPSRARRGAFKNIQDAYKRGWTGRKKKKQQQQQQQQQQQYNEDMDSTAAAGWTDVTWASTTPKSASEDRKCVVM